jgi:hypothetical protein
MIYSVSNWSGRLGNNIQQVTNALMLAEYKNEKFAQSLDHDIINKFVISFDEKSTDQVLSGRFYSWEPLFTSNNIFEGGNEIGLERDYIYENFRRICKTYVAPNLNIPEYDPLPENTIVMHLRSGDNYHRIFDPPTDYVPNPLIFYLNLIEEFENVILITEPDRNNPILEELEKIKKVKIQSKSVQEDFATLMSAKHIALSGVGTFAMAAAMCSKNIDSLYTTDLLLTEHLNYSMLFNTDVTVNVMELKDYIPVYPCSWKNTEEQRKFIIDYRI